MLFFFGKKDKGVLPEGVLIEGLAPEETSLIELYPDREVDKKDLEKFADVIEDRIKILGDNYKITVEDNKISLALEKAMLAIFCLVGGNTIVSANSTEHAIRENKKKKRG